MVEAATELIRTTENVIDAISGRRITGTFAIGSVRTSAIGLLPRAISRLISNHSGLKIRLRVGLSETLMQDVASGHLDTAMIAENGVSSPDVVWTPFIREPLCLVAPLGTPPAPLQQMLATHPYVRFKANVPLAKVIDRELSRMNPVLNEIAEMDNVAAVIACVANGLGISIVPQVATQNVSPQLVTIPFGDTPVYRQIGLLRRHTSPRHQLIDELHEHLAAVSGEYGVGLDTTGRSKA
ncbi:LysR substrate-binding domain-containing protein [Paracoccus laeviglucosivorans]|uniref:DNA-binding transcriptional regulator, LysR family n=1 Tax=Paracoccus laeviglucosivorans TaxID=1197861 RepID=A0A521EN00_9RHOB|nr:LysR substrate-binding domain-containing protein [Paracoccus laeviglucosivorans]SMO85313.1 DNA-binding transcriptional regulator, LysR family [Paracoccus laeviglucosivorans]